MTRRPRILDLFSGVDGAAVGYHRAGFDVVGVDHVAQPRYPFEFHRADALAFLADHGHEFDAIHASPPCQHHIAITAGNRGRRGWTDAHRDLIEPTRRALARFDLPTVIENGVSTALRADVCLCGLMFGLPTFRHRLFELDGVRTDSPEHVTHRGRRTAGWRHGVFTPPDTPGAVFGVYGDGGGKPTIAQAQTALGIDWTDVRAELNDAIPPAYAEFIGRELMAVLA